MTMKSEMVIPPLIGKALIALLQDTVNQYETNYGPLIIPGDPELENLAQNLFGRPMDIPPDPPSGPPEGA
jgi:hypothetical protein